MATTVAKNLFEAQLVPAADTLLYTCPGSTRTIVDKVTALNTDGSSAYLLTLYIVPATLSPATAYKILEQQSIAAKTARDCTEMELQILEAGDKIYAKADSASKISIRGSGREVTA